MPQIGLDYKENGRTHKIHWTNPLLGKQTYRAEIKVKRQKLWYNGLKSEFVGLCGTTTSGTGERGKGKKTDWRGWNYHLRCHQSVLRNKSLNWMNHMCWYTTISFSSSKMRHFAKIRPHSYSLDKIVYISDDIFQGGQRLRASFRETIGHTVVATDRIGQVAVEFACLQFFRERLKFRQKLASSREKYRVSQKKV